MNCKVRIMNYSVFYNPMPIITKTLDNFSFIAIPGDNLLAEGMDFMRFI